MPIIEFKDFSFQYRAQSEPTLTDINLKIYPGEKVLIAGPSGSGKSTLAHCINGLIPFNNTGTVSGICAVGGKETREQSVFALSQIVGTVLQDTDGQFIGLTAAEDIAFSLENEGIPQNEMRPRVLNAALQTGIEGDALEASPSDLSGGQKQRVSMAGVIIDKVKVLLFDEPLASLDPATGKTAIALIDKLMSESDAAVVIIEHRLEDVLYRKVDRVVLMRDGRIAADMSPNELLCGSLLNESGIREPLYVTACKYAGITLSPANFKAEELKPANGTSPVLNVPEKEAERKPINGISPALNEQEKATERKPANDISPVLIKPEKEAEQKPVNDMFLTLNEQEKESVRRWYTAAEAPAAAAEKEPLLTVEGLSFKYKETGANVLSDISFTIREGEMTAVVGTNGAGKSTLAKLICGFEKPDTGRLFWQGKDMSDDSIAERAANIGYVMQNPNQMICKPMIYDEVAFGLVNRNVPESEMRARVDNTLKICGLYPFRKWPVSALSYGQKKRVTIASVLVLRPKLLILDEPTAGQDFKHYTDIMEFLLQLNSQGVTVLLITHDMHLMLEYAPRALVFSKGKMLADISSAALLCDGELTEQASLKETSLFHLANMCGINDPVGFIRRFVAYERNMRYG